MYFKFIKEKALPNILVYFFKFSLPKEEEHLFINYVRKAVNNLYGQDRFVVYSVTEEDLNVNTRILSAKALLIITKQESSIDLSKYFQTKWSDLKKLIFNYDELCSDKFDFDCFHRKMKTLMPHESVNNDSLLDKNHDLFLFDSQNIHLNWSLLGSSLKLINYQNNRNESPLLDCSAFIIDWTNDEKINHSINFDIGNYFKNLRTECIGRSLLFQNVTSSTMSLVNHVKTIHGIVALTNYQTSGLGRKDNHWLSPFGCAMFTINLKLPLSTPLISKISLIQHIASLAIILAIPSKKLNLKIKWPNDILFVESMSKLAGILVKSCTYENHINVQVGIGINISNRHPSVCLDELIHYYNTKLSFNNVSEKIELIDREEMIAKTLNNFERLYNKLINDELDEIKQLYCENWIHTDAIISIHTTDANNESKPKRAKIIGINNCGYLLAKDLSTQNVLILQPNGNRFDMMNHLNVHIDTNANKIG